MTASDAGQARCSRWRKLQQEATADRFGSWAVGRAGGVTARLTTAESHAHHPAGEGDSAACAEEIVRCTMKVHLRRGRRRRIQNGDHGKERIPTQQSTVAARVGNARRPGAADASGNATAAGECSPSVKARMRVGRGGKAPD